MNDLAKQEFLTGQKRTYYVLTGKKRYSSTREIYGVVEDEDTAKRWVNWAEGDYYAFDQGSDILLDDPLESATEIKLKRESLEEKRFPTQPKTDGGDF